MAEIGGAPGVSQAQLDAAMASRAPAYGSSTTLFTLTANMNTTADQPFVAAFPIGAYVIDRIVIGQASINLTNAIGGLYTGAGKTGDVIVGAGQVYQGLTAPTDQINPYIMMGGQKILSAPPIMSLTAAQGVAATANIFVMGVATI